MLLARKGYRVLVVDRATFPSDTLSTHILHPPGAAACSAGVCSIALAATGCPPIDTYAFDFGPFTLAGAPGTDDSPVAYCPRRTVLDKLLVDAASEAGAEVREEFTVEEVVIEDGRVVGIRGHSKGGETVTERADVVVGADGRYSLVAKAVGPEQYNETTADPVRLLHATGATCPMDGRFEVYVRDRTAAGRRRRRTTTSRSSSPGWPFAEFEANKDDVEGNYLEMFEQAPEFAERIRGANARGALRGHRGRRTSSASRTAPAGRWSATPATTRTSSPRRESPTRSGTRSCAPPRSTTRSPVPARFDVAMDEYQATRDEHVLPMFEFTCQLATLEPPPPELQQLLGRGARQPGGDGRLRARQRRSDVTGRVLLRGERRPHLRRRALTRL